MSGLTANEVVTTQLLVLSKDIRQKKTGEPYLSLQLADRSGEVEAKMWDNVTDVMYSFDRDDFIKVKGLVQVYQNRMQLVLHRIRKLDEEEVEAADYFPCSERSPDEMFAELEGIITGIGNAHLRALLQSVFSDQEFATLYKKAPAAKSIHHAYRGGLLEHVLSLCTLCRLMAGHYKDIDLDLLLTGAILHDVGKVNELTYERSFGYSSEGQLLGHITIGLRIVGEHARRVENFPPRLLTLVDHLVLSHHGELAFGSPKVPLFAEALLLHHLDNLDSKMEAMRVALLRSNTVEGDFTGWIAPLERPLLKKQQYLSETDAQAKLPMAVLPPEKPETAPPDLPEAPVLQPLAAKIDRTPEKPESPTLFGEKLQAVLQSRK